MRKESTFAIRHYAGKVKYHIRVCIYVDALVSIQASVI